MSHDSDELAKRYASALGTVYRTLIPNGETSLPKQQAAEIERVSWSRSDYKDDKNLIVLSGMSGSGKTIIGTRLATEHGYRMLRNVYTRPPRATETEEDGIFVDDATFSVWKQKGEFITTSYTNGIWHGLLRSELETVSALGHPVWADKSVTSLQRLSPQLSAARLVYIVPPSFEELWERLTKREGTQGMKHDELRARIDEEIGELRASTELPYRYIINDSLDRVVELLVDH